MKKTGKKKCGIYIVLQWDITFKVWGEDVVGGFWGELWDQWWSYQICHSSVLESSLASMILISVRQLLRVELSCSGDGFNGYVIYRLSRGSGDHANRWNHQGGGGRGWTREDQVLNPVARLESQGQFGEALLLMFNQIFRGHFPSVFLELGSKWANSSVCRLGFKILTERG